ncbi:MAG TPA: hypothetical protein VFX02_06725 [Gammaproteobacteria bacterium]|nr:hypothetical protein [Gammaproteobacteria bacterium]
MRKIWFVLGVLLLPAAQTVCAGEKHEHAPVAMPRQFETLKQLLGAWEGTSKMGDKGEQSMQVTYELTSGGTAIIEKLMPGTPQEMVSVYHKEGDSLAMTHYCSMGNQPHMKLQDADAGHLVFEMEQPQGIASAEESHMHALTLTLKDKDTLQQDWISYDKGKPAQTTSLLFHKKS